ncbi:hypothetical protein LDENG_00011970 [Lucifuga dentata]|nr:hypothetical protein LDENG_00011970 [Lucifuga dentata]
MNQTLCLLMLLGLTVPSGVAGSSCKLISEDTCCLCSTLVIDNTQDLMMCVLTVELELRDGKLDHLGDISELAKHSQINKLIFNNVTISFQVISELIRYLPLFKVNEISIISSSITAVEPLPSPNLPEDSKIKVLQLENITVASSVLQSSFQPFHLWLFGSLKSLSLVMSGLVDIECYWAGMVRNLIHLDLSENPLSWTSLQNISRCSSLSFNFLASLSLRGSNLTSLQLICPLLSLMPVLTTLDVSGSRFSMLHSPQCFQVMESLRMLNLSHSGITTVDSLSKSLEVLDLSYNSLEVFHNPPQGLKELYLSNNRLMSLPSLANLSQLKTLQVDSNQLAFLINETETGVSQTQLERLQVLHAGRNPYQCDCALRETVIFLGSTTTVSVEGWPDEFMCATPEAMKGNYIADLPLEKCVKPSSGTQQSSSLGLETKTFSFDQVATLDDIQSFHPELLHALTESISSGYNRALLISGASTEKTNVLIDHQIIKQVLMNLFSRISSEVKGELFTSVSFLQFYPDGSAVDLLSPSSQTLKPVTHPVLGSLAGGVCEVCVCSAEEAFSLYETCRETLKANPGTISSRCSSLFSVAVEWKLHPEKVESEVFRSRLQLFRLAGGASRTDLRGVSPLVKILDQMQSRATMSDKLLPFLLSDALTGNSRTVLIYCIHPQGLLDDETPSALAVAQKVRGLVTKATVGCWCPREAEQEIRGKIMDLRAMVMSKGQSAVDDTYRLAELAQNLQIVKNQSWEKRREDSEKIKAKIKCYQSPHGYRHSSDDHGTDHRESTGTMKHLQDQLRQEMEAHIREGKGNVEKVQKRVVRIQQLREALREEMARHGVALEKSDPLQQSQLECNKAQERRSQLKEDHGRLIQAEVEKMERELAQEQTEGPQRELLVLCRERQVLVVQMEALRAEAQQAERDLEDQYHKHQMELHCLREESLKVFRAFRQVSDEQRKMSESRYRSVLLEAVQDAVYLSAQNQQLQIENKQLRKALGELKDILAVRGDPKSEKLPQQQ